MSEEDNELFPDFAFHDNRLNKIIQSREEMKRQLDNSGCKTLKNTLTKIFSNMNISTLEFLRRNIGVLSKEVNGIGLPGHLKRQVDDHRKTIDCQMWFVVLHMNTTLKDLRSELAEIDIPKLFVEKLTTSFNVFLMLGQLCLTMLESPSATYSRQVSIRSIVFVAFKEIVFDALVTKIRISCLKLIDEVRQLPDKSMDALIGAGIDMFLQMGTDLFHDKKFETAVYEKEFEEHLIPSTNNFYLAKASEMENTSSCSEYFEETSKMLSCENRRMGDLLPMRSREKVLMRAQEALLFTGGKKMLALEGTGLLALLKGGEDRFGDIHKIYTQVAKSFKPSTWLVPLAEIYHVYIKALLDDMFRTELANIEKAKEAAAAAGSKSKSSAQDAANTHSGFVLKIISVYEEQRALLDRCFDTNKLFVEKFNSSLEDFFQRPIGDSTFSLLLASHVDELLKSDNSSTRREISDSNFDKHVDSILIIFQFLRDKDMFLEYYRKFLAKRLLGDKANEDEERVVVAKLKFHQGASATLKLEEMINDIKSNEHRAKDFKEYCEKLANMNRQSPLLEVDLSVKVLKINAWPTYPIYRLEMPDLLNRLMEGFTTFYQQQESSKKLQWVHQQGKALVKCDLSPLASASAAAAAASAAAPAADAASAPPAEAGAPKAKRNMHSYEITMSTFQCMIVLSLVSQGGSSSLKKLGEATKIPAEDLARSIFPMFFGPFAILNKEPKDPKNILPDDVFSFNFGYRGEKIKFTLPQGGGKARISTEEVKSTNEAVESERGYVIDANVVRIMKSRKVLKHAALINELLPALHRFFVPDVAMIKRRIEDLINRDYLERGEERDLYKYKA